MSYVKHVLQPGEEVLAVGRLHWIIFWPAIFLFLCAIGAGAGAANLKYTHFQWPLLIAAAVFFALGLLLTIRAWWRTFITEIAVTSHRVIFKQGFINRRTEETNVDKIASVDVDQSILGRILGYGSIDIRSTGDSFESLDRISHPIELRNAITLGNR
jgi:uncharacterized membrane protein YdbT with pleckstrin-like domain